MAGVPVYSQPGRGGGWSLVGGARTDLSGLTASEARTLFLVAGPSSTATPDVKAALRKLVQALPETFRADAEAAANAVVLDPVGWDRNRVERPPQLDELERAVIDGVQVRLGYADRAGTASDRTVHPLGLAVKGTTWYLVANTDRGLRTFRVNRVQSVARTEQAVERPEGFDLEQTWAGIVTSLDEQRAPLRVRAVAERAALGWLRSSFGTRMIVREPAARRRSLRRRATRARRGERRRRTGRVRQSGRGARAAGSTRAPGAGRRRAHRAYGSR